MSKIYGVDCGTMFFQTAQYKDDGSIKIKTTRNAFVELAESEDEDIEEVLKQNDWHYVQDGRHYYVIGEDSLRVAKMFPGKVELRRPLKDGVMNKGEDKKMIVLAELVENSVGKAKGETDTICTCVSSESVDGSSGNTFHSARLKSMFTRLNWNVKIIEEGLAVVLSERPVAVNPQGEESPYSGLGISFGAGRVNCVLSFKGMKILGMSCAQSGDWIDAQVAKDTDAAISQIIAKKENKLDFDNIDYDNEIIFALDAYYTSMLSSVFKKFAAKFVQEKTEFDAPIPVVVAGGTSLPNGFDGKVTEVINNLELPFEIASVKRASDPTGAVVKGLLAQASITAKKLGESKQIDSMLGES
ncbi:MAG: hypothetical protein ACOC5T_03060 [Elusimicrobiota bacterium]